MGCGRIAPKSELLRIAAAHDRAAAGTREDRGPERVALAMLDRAGTMPGRGAYLCRGGAPGIPAEDCLALAGRRGALARALRCAVRIDPELVESVSP